jgi:3-oxoadipate enol-lactonase
MNVLEAGEDGHPAVIFLHGLGTGARAWQPQMDALSDAFHLLALYQPGYHTAPGPFTLDRAVQEIDAVFDRYDLAQAHLCGLSLGTMVALAFALHDPERVSSLMLCGGFARLSEDARTQTLAGGVWMRETPNEVVRSGITSAVPETYRHDALEDLAEVTGADLASITEQVAQFDVLDRLPEIGIPTLVLCGDRDEPNLPFCREIAEHIPGARLEIIPDAGHVANLDNPEAFTKAMRRFLERFT